MSSWVIWAVALAVVAVVVAVVVIALLRRQVAAKKNAPADLPVSRAPAVLEAPVQPIDPVMPADQARGYGWMKASDLIGQKPEN